ncbi:RluA family pseudouridine synthase [Paenibacillus sp. YPG26]|uniref:RluA family pseudouridine synthase n=1 Tax=Paenibacillus sp. YPG26 TaxID=2878915 RepID=UPI00203CD236|nr:RluA family pseudouridine synthase [Paenibacillus sp. YPG26]USB34244.1 RluA family pseudouridine synthase [Paenibacillus sp. YPG26]
MSYRGSAVRRGEWLEVMPGKLPQHPDSPRSAVRQWLIDTLGMPPKMLSRLEHEDGIKLAGDRIRIRLFPPRDYGFEPCWTGIDVLYEDDYCLVVHKPAGMKVHPTGDERQPTLAHVVAAHYMGQGEQAAVRHIHRLDEFTSGPVLYAKNEFAQLILDEAMSTKKIERVYVAVVQGIVQSPAFRVEAPIGRDRHHAKRQRVSDTGKPAATLVTLLDTLRDASLVRLTLETGRTHQIRVHMSHIGHPLIGDALYGGSTRYFNYQALHGESLIFPHPLTGEILNIKDPWPEEFIELHRRLLPES